MKRSEMIFLMELAGVGSFVMLSIWFLLYAITEAIKTL